MSRQDILLKRSKDIFDEAVSIHRPDAIVMMFSGGDDSLTCYHVARQLGIKFNFVMHGNTRTGIPQTTEFSRSEVERLGDKYLEADAGRLTHQVFGSSFGMPDKTKLT